MEGGSLTGHYFIEGRSSEGSGTASRSGRSGWRLVPIRPGAASGSGGGRGSDGRGRGRASGRVTGTRGSVGWRDEDDEEMWRILGHVHVRGRFVGQARRKRE